MKIHELSLVVAEPKTEVIKEWFTVKEVAEMMSVSDRTIQRRSKEFEIKTEKGLGGERILIKATSLPEYVKMKMFRQTMPIIEKEEETYSELPTKAREIALAKYDLISLWKEFRATTKLPLHKADNAFIHKYKQKAYPNVYNVLGGKGSIKSLYRDSRLLEENNNNFEALAPSYKFGKAGTVLCGEEVEALLKYIKYPQKLKVTEIIRLATQELTDNGFINIRNVATYRRWIEEWKAKNYDEWIFHREGTKALNDKVSFYTRRDKTLTEVGDLLIIDGHTTNFEILSPFPPFKPKRMTIVLVYDYRSDMPLGWEIMPSENKFAIASALRRALIFLSHCAGYPDNALKGRIVNIDNGRANKSKYLLGEDNKKSKWFNGDLKDKNVVGLFEKVFEGVSIARPYHGQTKTIERFFGTMSDFERQVITYSGTSIADKPARMMRNEKMHKEIYDRMMTGVAMTIEHAHYLFSRWFDQYSQREHVDGYCKGTTPLEIFRSSIEIIKKQPDFESRLLKKEQLQYLMLEDSITTLYRRGIRFMGREYFDPALYRFEKGKDKVNFRIKFDRENPESILVLDDKGNYLCTATEKKYLHPLVNFKGSAEEIQEYQNQLSMQRSLTQGTTSSFTDHFRNEIHPELPASIKQIQNKENAKQLKKGVKTERVNNDDLDLSIENEPIGKVSNSDVDDYDFKIL